MAAPVNFKLDAPTDYEGDWTLEADQWKNLNANIRGEVHGNLDFSALTIKGAYVVGIIYNICQSVSYLLYSTRNRSVVYIPAYGVFASAMDIFGRCIRGNRSASKGSTADLTTAFKYLVSSSPNTVSDTHVLITTSQGQYTIKDLVNQRHFAAHGQATSAFRTLDEELLSFMPALLADALDRYWNALREDEDLCNRLARANIIALRDNPIFTSWALFERDENGVYNSITTIFNKFSW